MILNIQTGSENLKLRGKSKSVPQITKKLSKLIKNMKQTMLDADGLGLAAPQVGEELRIFIANFQYGKKVGDKSLAVAMINPEILDHSEEIEMAEEGCLSLPEVYADVKRFKKITVKFLDEKGKEKILALEGLNARIVQHETDHLNGILFVDYLDESVIKKNEKLLAKANKF